MARASSAIVSPTEKKAVLADLKAQIKTANEQLKAASLAFREVSRAATTAETLQSKALAAKAEAAAQLVTARAALKAQKPAVRELQKSINVHTKHVTKLRQQLENINGAAA
jgi:phage-related tail protein